MNMYKGNYCNISNGQNKDDYKHNDNREHKDACEHKNTCGHKDTCEDKKCNECCEEKKCLLRPNHTFLKCSVPITTNIPMDTASGTSFNLTNLNIDTSKFRNPCIKFEFAGNVLTASGTLVLNFQIIKQCRYQPVSFPIGPVWTFSRLGSSVGENDSFTFQVCDCDICDNECCNYSVVVTIESLQTQDGIVINNATLSALVVENDNC